MVKIVLDPVDQKKYAVTFALYLGYLHHPLHNYHNNSHDQIIKNFYNNLKHAVKGDIHVDLSANSIFHTKTFIVSLFFSKRKDLKDIEELRTEISVAWFKTIINFPDVDLNYSGRVDHHLAEYRYIKNDTSYIESVRLHTEKYIKGFFIDTMSEMAPHIFSDRYDQFGSIEINVHV